MPEDRFEELRAEAEREAVAGLTAVVFYDKAQRKAEELETLLGKMRHHLAKLEREDAELEQVMAARIKERDRLHHKIYSNGQSLEDRDREREAQAAIENANLRLSSVRVEIGKVRPHVDDIAGVLQLLQAVEPPPLDVLPGLAEWLSLSR